MNDSRNNYLIASGTRAMPDEIPDTLYSVSTEFQNNKIFWQCIFDEDASQKFLEEDDLELLSISAAEVIADFNEEYTLEEIIKRTATPHEIPFLKNIIYLRND